MNCMLENTRQEKLSKNSAIRFQLAFVLTPKSAVKSSRQTRPIFSAITNSLYSRIKRPADAYNAVKVTYLKHLKRVGQI